MTHNPGRAANPRLWNRRLHRWGAAAIAVPFLVVVVTGILLQVKKQVAWIQPPELSIGAHNPEIPFDRILAAARTIPEARVTDWNDIDRLDIRPGKGILKLVTKDNWELQIHLVTGEVLQSRYRRSDFIESLHDMSWIHSSAKLWLGLPIGLTVLALLLTGSYLWWVHFKMKRRKHAAHLTKIVLLCATTPLDGQQIPDTLFVPQTSHPTFIADAGPLILIDQGHHNFHTLTGRYAPFANLMKRDGFRVAPHSGRITAPSLTGADILVIANALGDDGPWELPPVPAFQPEEVSVLVTWIEQGGALLLIADHMPFPGAILELGRAIGVEFSNGYIMTSPDERGIFSFRRTDQSLLSHPVTDGKGGTRIDSVRVFTGSAFRLRKAGIPLLRIGPGPIDFQPRRAWEFPPDTPRSSAEGLLQGALLQLGKGRVAVFGEAAMFSAQLAGPALSPMGFNHPAARQNAQFALNVLHWLAGLPLQDS